MRKPFGRKGPEATPIVYGSPKAEAEAEAKVAELQKVVDQYRNASGSENTSNATPFESVAEDPFADSGEITLGGDVDPDVTESYMKLHEAVNEDEVSTERVYGQAIIYVALYELDQMRNTPEDHLIPEQTQDQRE